MQMRRVNILGNVVDILRNISKNSDQEIECSYCSREDKGLYSVFVPFGGDISM